MFSGLFRTYQLRTLRYITDVSVYPELTYSSIRDYFAPISYERFAT